MITHPAFKKTKKVKLINNVLSGSKGSLFLNLEIKMDGKTIVNKRGDSLTAALAKNMYRMMNYYQSSDDAITQHVAARYTLGATPNRTITGVSDAGGEYSGKVKLTCSGGSGFDAATAYVICQGLSVYTSLNNVQTACVYLSSTTVVIPSLTYSATDTGTLDHYAYITNSESTIINSTPYIRVGEADGAVTINDCDVYKRNYTLTHGTTSSSPHTNTYPSYTRFSCIVTNNTGSAIVIRELGLFVGVIDSGNSRQLLMAREVLAAPISIPATSNITINYDVGVDVTSGGTNDGGFTYAFSAWLNAHLRYTQTAGWTDIYGGGHTVINNASGTSGSPNSLFLAGRAADRINMKSGTEYDTNVGVFVGTGDTAVAITDYNLATRIAHGIAATQLYHWATIVDNWVNGAGYVSYDIVRLFENRSGGTITIAETGLAASFNYNSTYSYVHKAGLIARNVLTTPVDVDNGEILKVTYTIRIEV